MTDTDDTTGCGHPLCRYPTDKGALTDCVIVTDGMPADWPAAVSLVGDDGQYMHIHGLALVHPSQLTVRATIARALRERFRPTRRRVVVEPQR